MKSDKITPDEKAIIAVDPNEIPGELPILPLNEQVAFPTLNMSLAVPMRSMPVLERAMKGNRLIGVVGTKGTADDAQLPGDVCETGTVVRVLYVTRAPDSTVLVIVNGLRRFRIAQWIPGDNPLKASIELAPEIRENDLEIQALHRNVRELTRDVFKLSLNAPEEAIDKLGRINDPLHLAYIAAAHSEIEFEKQQALLEEDSLKAKLRILMRHLTREKNILSLGKKIKSDARDQMNKSQRQYYLRQQLKAIKKELGEADETESEPDDYRQRIAESDMTDEARKEAVKELNRFEEMSPQSAEYAIVKGYLDWLLDLPWGHATEDQTDIGAARQVLDEDHYGLGEVKERVIEYLAVRNLLAIRDLNKTKALHSGASAATGVILCLPVRRVSVKHLWEKALPEPWAVSLPA